MRNVELASYALIEYAVGTDNECDDARRVATGGGKDQLARQCSFSCVGKLPQLRLPGRVDGF